MKESVLDASILLRFLINEDEAQNRNCTELMKRIAEGREHVYLHDMALADVIWTLKSFYKQSPADIRRIVEPIITLRGISMLNKSQVYAALRLFDESNLDWTDAVLAAHMWARKIEVIYSYDRDFGRVDGITRREPQDGGH